MKCTTHNSEAVAVCAYCGAALCKDCRRTSATRQVACSDECAAALAKANTAVELILRKSSQAAQASAITCYSLGALFVICCLPAWLMVPSPFLILFMAVSGFGLIASGFWYSRAARRQS